MQETWSVDRLVFVALSMTLEVIEWVFMWTEKPRSGCNED